jgi:hypothetical protein
VSNNNNVNIDLENLFDGESFDFGFRAVTQSQLEELTGSNQTRELLTGTAKSEDILRIEQKLDEILSNRGSNEDCVDILKTKMRQVESLILPLLLNLKKDADKDYIFWPNRTPIIDQQIQRILQVTRF